jgi:hypothetical protein
MTWISQKVKNITDQLSAAKQLYNTTGLQVAGTPIHAGSWGIGGFRLPDFGATEALASSGSGGQTNDLSNAIYGQDYGLFNDYQPVRSNTNNNSNNNRDDGSGGGIIGGNLGNIPGMQPPDYGAIKQNFNEYNSVIDQEYEATMNSLTREESNIRSQAQTSEQQIENENAEVKTQLGKEQATNVEGVNQKLSTAETESKSQLQQARDLFRETQQQNIMELSGRGISSSSVAEALAERLGVETARRIGSISSSLGDIRINAKQELGRINNYYSEKMTNLEREKGVQMQEIRNALMSGLNKISTSRDIAAVSKRRQLVDLAQQARQAISDISQEYEKFKQSLYKWGVEKSLAIQPIAAGKFEEVFGKQLANVQQSYAPSQFDVLPSYSVDKYGRVTGQIKVNKKDELQNQTGQIASPDDPQFWQ